MNARPQSYLSVLPLALLAGAILGNPHTSSAQFPPSDAAGFTRFADQSDGLPPQPEGSMPAPITDGYEQDVAPSPEYYSDESWTDWHGVPEVNSHPDDDPGFNLSYYQEHEFPEEEPELRWRIWESWMHLLEQPHEPFVHLSEFLTGAEHDGTVFTDPDDSYTAEFPIGIQPIMPRPPLPLGEFPQKFLGQGTIPEGFELPTGAVWRPTVWIFGSNRFGISYRDNQGTRNFGSVVNRLNLFGQLNLTGTEHFVIQLRPFDEEEGRPLLTGREFQTYFWKQYTSTVGPARTLDSLDGMNSDINTAYFEGQLDEIFPNLDPYDFNFLDLGFSVGRQPMSFQRGLMMNEDMIDAVTVTRNTLYGKGNLNQRVTFVYAWNRATRIAPVQPNTDAEMYGIFTESDFAFNTLNVDVGFINDPNRTHRDLLVAAISSTQRLVGYENTYNSRFHLLVSYPTEGEGIPVAFMGSPGNVSGQGVLLFSQISVTPHRSEDLIYWNTFVAIDQFTSLPRAPQAGPLGDTGLLFAASGLGLYAPALSTVTNSSVGTALGYQVFLDTKNQQMIYEIGAREGKGADDFEIAGAVQYQRAFKQNWIWLVTGFLSARHGTDGLSSGIRQEIQFFF